MHVSTQSKSDFKNEQFAAVCNMHRLLFLKWFESKEVGKEITFAGSLHDDYVCLIKLIHIFHLNVFMGRMCLFRECQCHNAQYAFPVNFILLPCSIHSLRMAQWCTSLRKLNWLCTIMLIRNCYEFFEISRKVFIEIDFWMPFQELKYYPRSVVSYWLLLHLKWKL